MQVSIKIFKNSYSFTFMFNAKKSDTKTIWLWEQGVTNDFAEGECKFDVLQRIGNVAKRGWKNKKGEDKIEGVHNPQRTFAL